MIERLNRIMTAVRARNSLLQSIQNDLAALRKRFDNLLAWVEIDHGSTVTKGTVCIYLGLRYEATQDHVKRLLDAPLGSNNWKRI